MELPIFPLNVVLFPGAVLPLHIFEERYRQMIAHCIAEQAPFGVCLIRSGQEVGGAAEPFEVGTTAHIVQVTELEEGRLNVVCTGGQRFRIQQVTQSAPYIVADVEIMAAEPVDDRETAHLVRLATELFAEYVRLNLAIVNQWTRSIEAPNGAAALSDHIAARIGIDAPGRQRLLEEVSTKRRLEVEIELLSDLVLALSPRVKVARAQRWGALGAMN